jgi:hypothetical protein
MRFLLFPFLALVGIAAGAAYMTLDLMPVQARSFANATPTGIAIYHASNRWMNQQIKDSRLTRKNTCALNVSHVMSQADADIGDKYANAWAPAVTRNVIAGGGVAIQLGKTRPAIVNALNKIYGGNIPVGALLNACYTPSCGPTKEHPTGSRHIGIIGEEENGVIFIHHNNYYKPVKGQRWQKWMISQKYLAKGIDRQWQRSPWLKLTRNSAGKIVDVKVIAPSQLNILNPHRAIITVAIPAEIVEDINKGRAFRISADGSYKRLNFGKDNIWLKDPVWAIKPYVHNNLKELNRATASSPRSAPPKSVAGRNGRQREKGEMLATSDN